MLLIRIEDVFLKATIITSEGNEFDQQLSQHYSAAPHTDTEVVRTVPVSDIEYPAEEALNWNTVTYIEGRDNDDRVKITIVRECFIKKEDLIIAPSKKEEEIPAETEVPF